MKNYQNFGLHLNRLFKTANCQLSIFHFTAGVFTISLQIIYFKILQQQFFKFPKDAFFKL